MARRAGTGRFATRKELLEFVWGRWQATEMNQTDIAAAARVGVGVVRTILATLEGQPGRPAKEVSEVSAKSEELSSIQAEVLKRLESGGIAERGGATRIRLNGMELCKLTTINALMRRGLVKSIGSGKWMITEEGKGRL